LNRALERRDAGWASKYNCWLRNQVRGRPKGVIEAKDMLASIFNLRSKVSALAAGACTASELKVMVSRAKEEQRRDEENAESKDRPSSASL
jgi:hypothetical protein